MSDQLATFCVAPLFTLGSFTPILKMAVEVLSWRDPRGERSTALATGLEQTKFAASSYPTNQRSENTEEQYHGTYWHHHLQGQPDDS